MNCPYCGHPDDKVVDSRALKDGAATRRRRECLGCGRRFTTYEYIEGAPLMVVKQDGRREPFDRAKLKGGIVIACAKRLVASETIEQMVREIEEQCYEKEAVEMSSAEIGAMVMTRLKAVDEVAYIRFASVYRRFQDAGEFRREVENL
ncbi:MAG: transcriptional repressor NrdR [Calditrichaeota bacterium]|nr:transcriptional repressor NrdR [Calditrichota bacterium]